MKNVAVINVCDFGSTGRITMELHRYLLGQGYNSLFCYGRGDRHEDQSFFKFCGEVERYIHAGLARLTGYQGCFSSLATKKLIRRLRNQNVEAVFAGNLHGYYLNEKMFFDYIIKDNIKLVYLMLDEYPLIGKCAFVEGCTEFENGCKRCIGLKRYPANLFFNRSREIFQMKMNAYQQMKRTAFVGPQVVIDLARKSPLLKDKNLVALDETIDVSFYTPRDTTELKQELGIASDKYVCVCIAPYKGDKNSRKGVPYYIELARSLENDERFVFVQVGYLAEDKSQLPSNYIPLGFINDQNKLCEYYSLGDLFVFPSLADSMPSACIGAMSCGTPLLCFDISGMSYMATPNISTFVEARNVEAMKQVVLTWPKKNPEMIQTCRDYAVGRYDNKVYNQKLIDLAECL